MAACQALEIAKRLGRWRAQQEYLRCANAPLRVKVPNVVKRLQNHVDLDGYNPAVV